MMSSWNRVKMKDWSSSVSISCHNNVLTNCRGHHSEVDVSSGSSFDFRSDVLASTQACICIAMHLKGIRPRALSPAAWSTASTPVHLTPARFSCHCPSWCFHQLFILVIISPRRHASLNTLRHAPCDRTYIVRTHTHFIGCQHFRCLFSTND